MMKFIFLLSLAITFATNGLPSAENYTIFTKIQESSVTSSQNTSTPRLALEENNRKGQTLQGHDTPIEYEQDHTLSSIKAEEGTKSVEELVREDSEFLHNSLRLYTQLSMVLGPLSFVLNGLSFLVFWHMKKVQTQAVLLAMMALTVADPLVALVNIDFVLFTKTGYSLQQHTEPGCRIIPYISTVARDCSNAYCVLIAVERFISVFFPLKVALWCTRRRILHAIIAITLFFVGIEAYRVVFYKHFLTFGIHGCGIQLKYHLLSRKLGMAITTLLGFLIPWVCIGILNFLIIVKLHMWQRRRRTLGTAKEKNNQSLTVMFLAISLFSLGTNIVDIINFADQIIDGEISIDNMTLLTMGPILILINHSCNFIFYALAGVTFRRTLCYILSCGVLYAKECSAKSRNNLRSVFSTGLSSTSSVRSGVFRRKTDNLNKGSSVDSETETSISRKEIQDHAQQGA